MPAGYGRRRTHPVVRRHQTAHLILCLPTKSIVGGKAAP